GNGPVQMVNPSANNWNITMTGVSYSANVTITDEAASNSPVVLPVTDNSPDVTPPTHTGSLTATPISYSQINLSWPAATDAKSGMHPTTPYKLVRATGATAPADCTGTAVYTGTALSYNDTGRTENTQYSYRVCAYDAVNNVTSGLTASATTPVIPPDTTPPTHTGSLTATPVSTSQINLSWPTATDAGVGMHATTPYKLVRATGATAPANCTGTAIYTGTATSYNNTGLTESTQYSYRVCAYDANNNVTTGLTATATTLGGGVTILNGWTATPQLTATTGNMSGSVSVSAGSNRMLVVSAHTYDSGGATGVTVTGTYGGRPLNVVVSENSNRRHSFFLTLDEAGLQAATSTTLSLTVTGTHTGAAAYVASYQGVNQSNPYGPSAIVGGGYNNNTNNVYISSGTTTAGTALQTANGSVTIFNQTNNLQTYSSNSESYTMETGETDSGGVTVMVFEKSFTATGTTNPTITYGANTRAAGVIMSLHP
ncbi:MAG: fibronectin type III domain-containing protein, partial [Proteobacteria bacterium]|nr:fibronectin type III domain-containing protein [Pseudomonadota bacterium]MBU1739183.1 fibronectin type III domain-containing protein [Pseudomonadota bacterium]